MSNFLHVDVRDTAVLASLRNGAKRQRYVIANALNTTIKAVQASIPSHLTSQGFNIRKKSFFFGGRGRAGGAANKITDFAKPAVGRQFARIAVKADRLVLPTFERGGTRKPFTPGAKNVAAPVLGGPARPSTERGVTRGLTFEKLDLQPMPVGKHPKADGQPIRRWAGKRRTFEIARTHSSERGLVLQRFKKGREGTRVVWAFITPPKLPAKLEYAAHANLVVSRVFPEALRAEVAAVLAFHRSGGGKRS